MKIELFLIIIRLSLANAFLPFALTEIKLFREQQTNQNRSYGAFAKKTTSITTTSPATTTTAVLTQKPKSIFEEHEWLDNIVQLVCERLLRLVKLLIQKFMLKQEISLADFLMNVLIA